MDTGRAVWERAVMAASAGKALRLDFDTPKEARKFARKLAVARARNAREVAKLYPELPPEKVKSEWDGLEIVQIGAELEVRPARLPKMRVVPL